MFELKIQDVLDMTRGEWLAGTRDTVVSGISTDSRTAKPGELFIALRGEHFDGHCFLAEVVQAGIAAIVVDRVEGEMPPNVVVIRVADTLAALGDLAHGWRRRHPIPVVALTGTSGKTTTKELIRDCLTTDLCVLATEGNFNNLIGVPKTVFRLEDTHEVAVIEMGMNRFGEIRRLAEIAVPQYGLITNIGAGHTEGVGGIDGVAKAKGELLDVLDGEGCFFANAEDSQIGKLLKGFAGDVISYGFRADCDIVARDFVHGEHGLAFIVRTPWEVRPFHTRFWGRHQVLNALAAIAVAQSFGISLAKCATVIEAKEGEPGRGRLLALAEGVLLLDDAYNANPTSVCACLDWFRSLGDQWPQKIFVFGTMYELGAEAEELHREMIREAVRAGVNRFYLFGEFSPGMVEEAKTLGVRSGAVCPYTDVRELAARLRKALVPGTALAVKASHACGFDAIVTDLMKT